MLPITNRLQHWRMVNPARAARNPTRAKDIRTAGILLNPVIIRTAQDSPGKTEPPEVVIIGKTVRTVKTGKAAVTRLPEKEEKAVTIARTEAVVARADKTRARAVITRERMVVLTDEAAEDMKVPEVKETIRITRTDAVSRISRNNLWK